MHLRKTPWLRRGRTRRRGHLRSRSCRKEPWWEGQGLGPQPWWWSCDQRREVEPTEPSDWGLGREAGGQHVPPLSNPSNRDSRGPGWEGTDSLWDTQEETASRWRWIVWGPEKSSPPAGVRSPGEACGDAVQVRGAAWGGKPAGQSQERPPPNHFLVNCQAGGGT